MPGDSNVEKKEREKTEKYQDFAREISRLSEQGKSSASRCGNSGCDTEELLSSSDPFKGSLEGDRNSKQDKNTTEVCVYWNGHHFEKGP